MMSIPNDDRSMPQIVPLDFWIDTEDDGAGGYRDVEWVKWTKKGTQNAAVTSEKVRRVQKAQEWAALAPHYDAWKRGLDARAVVNGTPLNAWAGVTRDQVKTLAAFNLFSVEDIATLPDAQLVRVNVPNIRTLQAAARQFIAGAGEARLAKQIAERDERIAFLEAQVEELIALVKPEAVAEDAQETPRRRGRPPKVREEAAA